MKEKVTIDDFNKIDIRVGTIVDVQDFPEARHPAYKLFIDFGERVGVKQSSAQITRTQTKEDLLGRQVIAVVNFEPRQVGPFMSEVLTLGVPDKDGDWAVLSPSKSVENGGEMH